MTNLMESDVKEIKVDLISSVVEFEALLTERAAWIAKNYECERAGQNNYYDETDFLDMAQAIRSLGEQNA